MSGPIDVGIFNARAREDASLGAALNHVSGTRLAWQVSTPPQLWEHLVAGQPAVLIVSLDPDHAETINLLGSVSARYPSLKLIACSTNRTPDLIITAMRHGCSQFVLSPIDADDLKQAITRVTADSRPQRASGRRITVVGAAGGAGATAIACNLATEMAALSGKDTALIDLNLGFGDVAGNFDRSPKHTLADLIGHDEIDADLVRNAMERLDNGVWLLARPPRIEESFAVTAELLGSLFQLLPATFEASIIDAERRYDNLGLAVLENSDVILVVMQLLVPQIHNGKRLYDALQTWGVNMDRVHLVVNRYQKGRSRIEVSHAEKVFNKRILAAIPNDYRAVTASLEFGRPMMSENANSVVRLAIRDLANRLTQPQIVPPTEQENGSGRGLLKRIFA